MSERMPLAMAFWLNELTVKYDWLEKELCCWSIWCDCKRNNCSSFSPDQNMDTVMWHIQTNGRNYNSHPDMV